MPGLLSIASSKTRRMGAANAAGFANEFGVYTVRSGVRCSLRVWRPAVSGRVQTRYLQERFEFFPGPKWSTGCTRWKYILSSLQPEGQESNKHQKRRGDVLLVTAWRWQDSSAPWLAEHDWQKSKTRNPSNPDHVVIVLCLCAGSTISPAFESRQCARLAGGIQGSGVQFVQSHILSSRLWKHSDGNPETQMMFACSMSIVFAKLGLSPSRGVDFWGQASFKLGQNINHTSGRRWPKSFAAYKMSLNQWKCLKSKIFISIYIYTKKWITDINTYSLSNLLLYWFMIFQYWKSDRYIYVYA